jgi:uncharacterized protein (DUF433 family)
MNWPQLPPCPFLEFLAPDDVRVKGTRIDLSLIVDEYLSGRDAEDLVSDYPSLDLERVFGVLSYYMGNREPVEQYAACVRQRADERYQAYLKEPPSPVVERLRALRHAKRTA